MAKLFQSLLLFYGTAFFWITRCCFPLKHGYFIRPWGLQSCVPLLPHNGLSFDFWLYQWIFLVWTVDCIMLLICFLFSALLLNQFSESLQLQSPVNPEAGRQASKQKDRIPKWKDMHSVCQANLYCIKIILFRHIHENIAKLHTIQEKHIIWFCWTMLQIDDNNNSRLI